MPLSRARVLAAALVISLLAPASFAAPVGAADRVTWYPVGQQPQRIVVDATDRLVYATGSGSLGGVVTVLDADTGAIRGTVDLPGSPAGLALDPAGGGVLVGILGQTAISRVRGGSLSLGVPIPTPYRPATREMAVDPGLGRVYYVASVNTSSRAVAIDLATGTAVGSFTLQSAGTLAIDAQRGRVYASDGSRVIVLGMALQLTTFISTPRGIARLATDPSRGRLYAQGFNVGTPHTIINTDTNSVVGELTPGTSNAMSLAVDPARGRVYVSHNEYPNAPHMTVYESDQLVETIPLPDTRQPSAMAIDSSNGNVWVVEELDKMAVALIRAMDPVAAPDADGDGTNDDVDADGGAGTAPTGSFSDDTGDGFTTSGQVTDAAGLTVAISDEADPDGVRITVGAGTGRATVSVCAGFTIRVNAGSSVVVTCGSVRLGVDIGSADIVLGGGSTVISVLQGGEAKATETGSGSYAVANLGSTPITVTKDGISGTVAPNTTQSVTTWRFDGFAQPIDNLPTNNSVKAGQAIPVKWRVLDRAGVPVTNLATATITATSLSCSLGSTVDNLEEIAAGASGLQNLGNGYYQLNWKSPKTYASSCKTLHLAIGDGVSHDAAFQFLK